MTTLYASFGTPSCTASDARLGPVEARLMTVLFDADGTTETALGRRVAERRRAVAVALDALTRRGLVEQAASRVWLTAGGFALRREAGPGRLADAVLLS